MKEIRDIVKTSYEKFKERQDNGGELKREPQPMSQEMKDYLEKLKKPTIITPTQEQVIQIIWSKLNKRANDGKFDPTNKQSEVMNFLFKHFAGDEQKKGVCLIGTYGCGKTEILKAFITTRFKPFNYLSAKKNCLTTSSIEMVDYYNKDQNFDKFFENHLYIDDFGSEQRAKYMAKDEEPILSKFLELWYLRRGEYRLYLTTNLGVEELRKKYGGRVLSRLKQLCDFIELKENDQRR